MGSTIFDHSPIIVDWSLALPEYVVGRRGNWPIGQGVCVQWLMPLDASVLFVMFWKFKGTFLYISMRRPSVMSSYDQCPRN